MEEVKVKLTREEAAKAVTPYGLTPEQFVYLIRRNCTVAEAKVMLAAPQLLAALEECQKLAIDRISTADAAVKTDVYAADALMGIAKTARDAIKEAAK